MLQSIAADVVFTLGLAILLAGVWLQFGLPATLIAVGAFLIILSLRMAALEDTHEPGQEDIPTR